MRIDRLTLKAFAHFTDFPLHFDDNKNFHIIYGPNEAGKSSILRAAGNLLYGFPQRTSDSFLHDNKNLLLEGAVSKRDGESLEFMRRKGSKNTLIDIENNVLNDAVLAGFLSGITEDHFKKMFALDHVSLREGGQSLLESEGDAGESLFSAASGISILRKVLGELDNEARQYYLKSGKKQKINVASKKEKELTRQVADYQLKIQEWKELERNFQNGKMEIDRLNAEIKTLGAQEKKLERMKKTLPKIALRKDLLVKLSDLGNVPDLPADCSERRKTLQAKQEMAMERKRKAEEMVRQWTEQLNSITIPEGILENRQQIEALYREVENYIENVNRLPRLKGEYEQLKQALLSKLKQINPDYSDEDDTDRLRVSGEKKRSLQTLIESEPVYRRDYEAALEERNRYNNKINQLKEKLANLDDLPDLYELEDAVDTAKRLGDIENELEELRKNADTNNQFVISAIETLPLWDGKPDELLSLKIPALNETVRKYQRQFQDLYGKLEQIKQSLVDQKNAVERNKERIRELESLSDIPSAEDLKASRSHRDSGWQLILQKLNGEPPESEKLLTFSDKGLNLETTFERSMLRADDLADKMRVEAEKVGEKNKLNADIEKGKLTILQLEDHYLKTEQRLEELQSLWSDQWKPAGIKPLSPDEMTEWLETYYQIKSAVNELNELIDKRKQLEKKYNQACGKLVNALKAVKKPAGENLKLDNMLLHAERVLAVFKEKVNERKAVKDALEETFHYMDETEIRVKSAEGKKEKWRSVWKDSLNGLDISSDTPVKVVKDLLDLYESCVADYDNLQKQRDEIRNIENLLEGFRERVSLLSKLTEEDGDFSPDTAVNKLYKEMQKASDDTLRSETLDGNLEKEAGILKEAEDDWYAAEKELQKLMQAASCQTAEELEQTEILVSEKRHYEKEISFIEKQLTEMGDGRTVDELLEEASGADSDTIDLELDAIRKQVTGLNEERSVKEQDHGAVKKEYFDKIEGSSEAASSAVEERQSVLSQMAQDADQYIHYKLASLLLKKGIEYYRERNQSPIISRASDIFQRITLNSFDGLTIDFNEKDEPVLAGIRNENEKVHVSGMSDGTKDQLYLSLRIASIEKFADNNEPVPFIVDDILVHFDDERSKETLKVLFELSNITQIIFFTHHKRLTELASEADPSNYHQLLDIERDKLQPVR